MTGEEYALRLAEMIRCRTISASWRENAAEFARLRAVVAKLFPLVHERAQRRVFGEDCWVYKLPGRDGGRNIALMSHHDVVAAAGDWAHPPFAGEIWDGRLWGRGTVDTKTSLFAEFTALEELLGGGWQPPVNVYLISSHNEELGGDGLPKALAWFQEQGVTFEVVLDEGGAVVDPPMVGLKCKKCAGVAVHEKGRYWLTCTARSGGGAGFSYGVRTPVERMSGFIGEACSGKKFIRRLNPQVRAMFSYLAPHCKLPLRLVLCNLWLTGGLLTWLLPRLSAEAGELLGTTCTFSNIDGSRDRCTARASFRAVDAGDLERDLAALRALGEQYGVEIAVDPASEYHEPADLTRPAFAYTLDCIRQVFPDAPPMPYILPAMTDARWLTGICPCVLRFAPIRLSPQQLSSVHAQNENIDLSAIEEAVAFYRVFLGGIRETPTPQSAPFLRGVARSAEGVSRHEK